MAGRRLRVVAAAAALACAAGQLTLINTINVSAAVIANGGFPTSGGEYVLVGADNLPIAAGANLHMIMRSAAFPPDLTVPCALLGSPTASTPGMQMVCTFEWITRRRGPTTAQRSPHGAGRG